MPTRSQKYYHPDKLCYSCMHLFHPFKLAAHQAECLPRRRAIDAWKRRGKAESTGLDIEAIGRLVVEFHEPLVTAVCEGEFPLAPRTKPA